MPDKNKAPAKLVIPMTACKSSNVSHYGYDAASQTLAITFSSGETYHYGDVPAEKAAGLGKAKSIGGFFSSDIRNAFKGVKQERHRK